MAVNDKPSSSAAKPQDPMVIVPLNTQHSLVRFGISTPSFAPIKISYEDVVDEIRF